MTQCLTNQLWERYERDGYLRLGQTLDAVELQALQERIDALMLGTADVNYDRFLMQLDSEDGAYGNAGAQTRGHKGATLQYRKIQDLEFDAPFLNYMERPVFREICARVYGSETPIAAFRAMFMNKPANRGTFLPWHQDRWNFLDRDPLITIWTALDPATVANGCVQVIEGSHKFGLLNPSHQSGFVSPEQAEDLKKNHPIVFLELEPGECVLLHNWLLHSSDKNSSDVSRRAFSVCYMDASTQSTNGEHFTPIFNATAAA